MPIDNQNQLIWKPVLKIGVIAILYFVIGRLSLSLVVEPENIAVIWPLSGIFLSAVLLTEKRFRPWLVGVLFLTNFIVEMIAGSSVVISLFYAFSLAFDASFSAWLLLRFIGPPFSFHKLKHVFLFLALSVIGSNAIASCISALAPTFFLSASYWESWKWWFTSDGVGNLLVTPLVLSWAYTKKDEWKAVKLKMALEITVLFISMFLVQYVVFKRIQENTDYSAILSFIIFPFLIWAGLRAGIRGVATASVLLAAINLHHLLSGSHLPPDSEVIIKAVLGAQLIIAIISISSLFLAAVVTERKLVIKALRESEERLTFHDINSPLANIEWDTNFVVTRWTGAAEDIFGWTESEAIGKSIMELNMIYEEDIPIVEKTMEKLTSGKNTQVVSANWNITKSGRVIYCEWYNSVLLNADGKMVSVMTRALNVTDRKQAEKELKESRYFFEQLFVQSTTSTQLLDKEGWCIKINPKLSELFGVLPEHIEGKKYNILQDGEIISTGVIKHLKKVFENLETVRWEVNFDIKHASETTGVEVSNPQKKWFSNIAYPILNAEGKLNYVIVQHEDITRRKMAELEIKKINQELEKRVEERTAELNENQEALLNLVEDLNEKSEQLEKSSRMLELKNKELETFTYSVSHDLKAPLRGIDGYSQLLEEEYSDILKGDGKKFVKIIREGTKQMNQLIEDLLAYSRLERSTLRPASIEAKPFIDSILTFFKNDIQKKNVKVETDIYDCKIFTDSDGLTIALRNIIENAIKFSGNQDRPKIKISLKENVSSWLLSVEDNGIGFDMKYHKRIFEIFQRLNLPEQYTGTGIGLAMVYKSVERMNGKIWAESELGKGAKFYIEILKMQ